jgi:hypothetical protein
MEPAGRTWFRGPKRHADCGLESGRRRRREPSRGRIDVSCDWPRAGPRIPIQIQWYPTSGVAGWRWTRRARARARARGLARRGSAPPLRAHHFAGASCRFATSCWREKQGIYATQPVVLGFWPFGLGTLPGARTPPRGRASVCYLVSFFI